MKAVKIEHEISMNTFSAIQGQLVNISISKTIISKDGGSHSNSFFHFRYTGLTYKHVWCSTTIIAISR